MIFAGIDAGSRAIKVALINEKLEILGSGVTDQGVKQKELAFRLLEKTLNGSGLSHKELVFTVATGYGRDGLDFANTTITEITCHARGVIHLSPNVKTIIDIGGQDSKLIRMGENGGVRDFVMNDRCAAGTGRFLEVVAQRLEIPIRDLGDFAQRAGKSAAISSMCVVFAETEIIGLLASGEIPENIVSGVQNAIATRIRTMAGHHVMSPIIFTGGVAMINGMKDALESVLIHPVLVSENPQMTGALGAAILAVKQASGS
jgi:predicted CoA-substrate-specific enzyme activase